MKCPHTTICINNNIPSVCTLSHGSVITESRHTVSSGIELAPFRGLVKRTLLLTTMWPVKVQRQFDIAQAAGNDVLENVLHAPYNKLLNTLFPVDTDFTVIPNFQEINSTKGADYLVTFEIFLENRPVFVLALKREKDFSVRSKRTAADDQLRGRLGDLIGNDLLPLF
jgi:hypothetical protein